ncbi:MAG: CHAT domain-containing protein [Chloroflexi bacterium]|nr:CHAT domain-containing protein [Chloroflexota bacterium]
MTPTTLTDLALALRGDETAGFRQFRRLFFEALQNRQLDACQALLDVLADVASALPSKDLPWESAYHEAIIFSERKQFDRAEARLRELLGRGPTLYQRARALLTLGIQFNEQGQWPEAESAFRQAQTAYAEIGDDLGQAKAYNNLGIAITFPVEQGTVRPERLPEAVKSHQAALAILGRFPKDAPNAWEIEFETARNWHGLGMAYGLMGQAENALNALLTHTGLCAELDDPGEQAIGLSDLAVLAHAPLGQRDAAYVALDKAIALFGEHHDPLFLAEALTRRGNLRVADGRFTEALQDYDAAIDHAEAIRTRLTAPTVQAGYRAMVEFIYAAPVALHLQRGEFDRAFTAAERSRSRVLADLLAGRSARPHEVVSQDLLTRRDELRVKLDQAYAADEPPAGLQEMERALADLDHQIELLDPVYAGLTKVASLTAQEVQALLPPGSALLTYVRGADDHLWVLVVTATDVHGVQIPRLSVRWLQAYLADHFDGVRRGSLVPDPQTGHLASPRLLPDLYRALIEPVGERLRSVQTLYIVPFGPLHYIPLGALLPDLDGPAPLLAPGQRVVYAPSATVLFKYCHTHQVSGERQGILAVAPADTRLRYIQGAAQAVARHASDVALVGPAATRQALINQGGRHAMLLFLGHAFFDRRYPMSSGLQLADGRLQASEILRELRLQAELVILAACESGRGQVLRGEEILGLSRALLYAGSPALVVTLWPVHEIPTRLFAEKLVADLYPDARPGESADPALILAATQRWLRGLSYAETQVLLAGWGEIPAAELEKHLGDLWRMTRPGEVPQASSQLFAHPFFWAPYIVIGERGAR